MKNFKNFKDYFKNKKITLMGLGLLGRGVGDAKFLAEQGADLIVTDLKTEGELILSLQKLKSNDIVSQYIKEGRIKFHLGGHKMEDFKGRDMILKSAGVPLDSPFILEARKNNIPVEMSAALLVKLSGAKTVGVTGTRGKSTVTELIYETLKDSYELGLKRSKKEIGQTGHLLKPILGGNVRGVANLPLLNEIGEDSILVLELDSWQLQGFGEANLSPNIAVFTNLKLDHLNYYQNDVNRYFEDKANIFKYQKKGDVLITGENVAKEWILKSNPPVMPIVPEKMYEGELNLIGDHNKENAMLAREALLAVGISEEQIKKSFASFNPVEGRLQFMREVGGVKIYNDNNATTPDATIMALKAVNSKYQSPNFKQILNSKSQSQKQKKIVLIFGGSDKGLDIDELIEEISKYCKAVVLLPGTGTDRIKNTEWRIMNEESEFRIQNSEFSIPGRVSKSLSEAIEYAFKYSEKWDTILFSPAFASFGLFKNEYDRNDQFVEIVNNL